MPTDTLPTTVSPSRIGTLERSVTPTGPWDATVDPLGTTTMRKSDGGTFRGACETGEEFAVADCSTKLIGARAYPDTFVDSVPEDEYSPAEFLSPRDGGGHGSHTASTAASVINPKISQRII